jgi:hypothetical protein
VEKGIYSRQLARVFTSYFILALSSSRALTFNAAPILPLIFNKPLMYANSEDDSPEARAKKVVSEHERTTYGFQSELLPASLRFNDGVAEVISRSHDFVIPTP